MIDGPPHGADSTELVNNSALYKEFLAERREILCHKWIESEKAGYDIGFERALINWVVKYRSTWREKRQLCLGSSQNTARHLGDSPARTQRKPASAPRRSGV